MVTLSLLIWIWANYANNKGFGYDLNPGNSSEFSDGGWYIYTDYKINSITQAGMAFELINDPDGNDNVSCKEQIIAINSEPQDYIMILGGSEWGSHYDKIELVFTDGEKSTIDIGLTNVAGAESVYGNEKIPVGKYVFKGKDSVDLTPYEASLYAKVLPVGRNQGISRLKLPYCPNMHIFAISFARNIKENRI